MNQRFMDTSLTFDERVDALIEELTLVEKLTQMLPSSPAIERLYIPSYTWRSECSHGVAQAGVATVFPQSIGMAATFNEDLIYDIATAISNEVRAKYHEFQRQGDHGMYKGLTFWSPSLNIFRDPRMCHGQETYGEDSYLASRVGLAFIEGLQGDDDKYLKVAACAKYFAIQPSLDKDRQVFKPLISPMDLFETYLPAFETAVIDAKVEALVSATNPIIKNSYSDSQFLYQEILYNQWEYEGHIISDRYYTYDDLCSYMDQGLLSEEDIKPFLRRLFMTRFKLGQFDPIEKVPFSSIPYDLNDSKEHHKLSLEASIQSMVLLKNNGILPLNKDKLNTIAVIGPNADDKHALLGRNSGTSSVTFTPLDGIKLIVDETTRVFYSEGCCIHSRIEPLSTFNACMSEALSAASYSDVTLVCLGLNALIETIEIDANNVHIDMINNDMDNSGDFGNNSLQLPTNQLELIEALSRNGSKLITVIFSGRPLELERITELSDAVIQAWYPGPFGGLALARLLFGHRDFSGRLPITFVRSAKDLPDFYDYSMNNRTYKFINTSPLYSFGYGRSYNTYTLKIDSLFSTIQKDTEKEIKIIVKNTGAIGSFVPIQVYVKPFHSSYRVPNFKLIHIETIYLNTSETKTIILPFDSRCVQTVNNEGEWSYDCKSFMIYIGFSQPDSTSTELLGFKPYEKKVTLT